MRDHYNTKWRKIMKHIQVNHNVLNKELIKEIRLSLVSFEKIFVLIGLTVIFFVLSVYQIIMDNIVLGTIFSTGGAMCIGGVFYSYYTKYHHLMDIFQDVDNITYSMSFGNDGLSIHNCYLGSHTKIAYSQMRRLKETKNSYTIFANNHQFAMIRKDCLKINTKELLDFLKSQDTKIKRWPKIK